MEFQNNQIQLADLPKAEEVDLVPIDERYYTVILYNQVLLWFVLFIVLLVVMILNSEFHSFRAAGLSLLLFAALGFSHFRLRYLSFKNMAFAIREHDLLFQSGWLIKSLHVCPFRRIQHCSIHAGVFERNLGICKLKVYSAGEDGSDILIPGLLPEQAESLRELILEKNQA